MLGSPDLGDIIPFPGTNEGGSGLRSWRLPRLGMALPVLVYEACFT